MKNTKTDSWIDESIREHKNQPDKERAKSHTLNFQPPPDWKSFLDLLFECNPDAVVEE